MCRGGNCVPAAASLSASYTINTIQTIGEYTYYYLTILISESNNVGVTINSVQLCFTSIGCSNPPITPFAISAGSSTTRTPEVNSKYHPDQATITYLGIDNNGHSQSVNVVIPMS